MGDASRLLSLVVEKMAFVLSWVDTHVPDEWCWAGGGVLVLLVGLFFAARLARRRRSRARRSERRRPEATVSDLDGPAPDERGGGLHDVSPGGAGTGASTGAEIGPPRDRAASRPEEDTSPAPREPEHEESLFIRLKGRLSKTQGQFTGRLDQVLFRGSTVGAGVMEEMEEVLVTADLGVKTSYDLLGEVQNEIGKGAVSPRRVREILKQRIGRLLSVEAEPLNPGRNRPFVIMLVGVNGVGKTTTAGKLAARLGGGGRKVMLVAADTFRPAAIEQLQAWSERVGTDFVKHQAGADPSAVVFDALHAARSRGSDLVLVDTAGRLHTKKNLMEELKKVKKVMGRELEGAPHEILLVLDANTGQNGIHQARMFHESLGVTGLILTKLDGTAKGGMIVGISNELKLPVRFIGIGERIQDLQEFDASLFLNALFGEDAQVLH